MFMCFVEFDIVGGVSYAEMLGRSNLLAIVGGGQAPKFPDRNGTVIYKISVAEVCFEMRIITMSSLFQ